MLMSGQDGMILDPRLQRIISLEGSGVISFWGRIY